MRRTGIVLIMIIIGPMLCGFTIFFKVKNTDGLRSAYEKIELAYPLAAEIAARKDLKAKDRQALIDSYNEAKASMNSFLKNVKTTSINGVDVPKDAFERDRASQKIDEFINAAKASRKEEEGEKAIPVAIVVAIAAPIIDKVWELTQKNKKEAYERFTKVIDDNMMVDFNQVSVKLKR